MREKGRPIQGKRKKKGVVYLEKGGRNARFLFVKRVFQKKERSGKFVNMPSTHEKRK